MDHTPNHGLVDEYGSPIQAPGHSTAPTPSLGEDITPDMVAAYWNQLPPLKSLSMLHQLIERLDVTHATKLKASLVDEDMAANAGFYFKQLETNITKLYSVVRTSLWEKVGKQAVKFTTPLGVKVRFTAAKPRVTRKVDWARFRKEQPEIFAQYVQESTTVPQVGSLFLS